MIDLPSGGAAFLMECLDIHGMSKYSAKLGEQLARLEMYILLYINQSGFYIPTPRC